MANPAESIGNAFAAGALGGLANAAAVWGFGVWGLTAALDVAIAPALTKGMVYQRMVWGGIWGFLFLLPALRSSVWGRGLLWSLGPTLVQLLYVFPVKAGRGYLGLELGLFTPLFVVVFNAVWGWAAALWLRAAGR
jgi:hypothetical protein